MSALGPFGMNGNTNVLLEPMKSGPNPEVANMVLKRFVKFSEPAEGKKIDNEILKTLTGGDAIVARRCFSNETDHLQNHLTIVLEVCNKINNVEPNRLTKPGERSSEAGSFTEEA